MADLLHELVVGAAGSVIGAAIVYFGSTAARIGKGARERAQKEHAFELKLWKTRKIQVRMEITNYYLFDVLRFLLLGSIFTIIPSIVSFAFWGEGDRYISSTVFGGLTLIGLGYYFTGLGRVIRYLEIRRSDQDDLKSYVPDEQQA